MTEWKADLGVSWRRAYRKAHGEYPILGTDPLSQNLHIWEDGVWRDIRGDMPQLMAEYQPLQSVSAKRVSDAHFDLAARSPRIDGPTHGLRRGVKHEGQHSWINLANGVLDLHTGELMPHGDPWNTRNQIPWDYDEEATDEDLARRTEPLDTFMTTTLGSREAALLWTIMGSLLLPGFLVQEAYLLTGKPGSGKSTLLNAVQALVGEDNCASTPASDLGGFATWDIYGKLVNVANEASTGALDPKPYRSILSLTGDDTITANRKYLGSVSFRWQGKLILSSNGLPTPPSKEGIDAGWWRRAAYFTFPKPLPKGLTMDESVEAITGDMDAIATRAARAIMTAIHSEGEPLERTPTMIETSRTAQGLSNPVQGFIADCIDVKHDGRISGTDAYDAYTEWCAEARQSVRGRNSFYSEMEAGINKIGGWRVRTNSDRNQYRGVTLRIPNDDNHGTGNVVHTTAKGDVMAWENVTQASHT